EQLRGTVVGTDEETDVAVVKVNAGRELPAVALGDSDDAQVGDWVLAIGSPFGLEQTVTAGIISTKERQTDQGASFPRFIQKAAGAIIRDVADAQGPAAKAGIQTNDIIVEYNGQEVGNAQDLINKVASTPVGQTVPVVYLREINNKLERRGASITVGERPAPRNSASLPSDVEDQDGKKLKLAPTD